MNTSVDKIGSLSFLKGGGEMGRLMRSKDWSATAIGEPEYWPQSLRTTISIILNSKFPMFLWWGPELISFYNDAYRPSLGNQGKHPSILGMPAIEAWPEIWLIIKPLIDQVLAGGEATWSEDQLIPIYRNGKIEDVYWTFSYSPVNDESEKVAGVLVTCMETTDKVLTLRKIEEADKRFRTTVKQAPIGMTILRGDDFMVEMANNAYLELVDRKEEEFVGRPLFDSLPEVEETVHDLLDNVLKTGVPFHGIEYPIPVNRYGTYAISYFNFLYYPLKEDGKITGIIVTVSDVTESVKAKHSLTESEKQFRNLVMQSPVPMTIFSGADYVIEMANIAMFENIWRKKAEDVVNKKLLEVFPELRDQKYPKLLGRVLETGKLYKEIESLAYVQGDDGLKKFYLDFEYKPLVDPFGNVSGIMVTANDVTEKVEARKKVEESEERLNIIIEASGLGTWELNLKTDEMNFSDRYLEIFGHPGQPALNHYSFLSQIHPDDLPIREKAFGKAMITGILNYEVRVIWEDKTLHWIKANGKVFYDDQNQPARMIGTIRDITEEKAYQEELEEREQKFRLLADSMPQHIWTSDTDGKLNYFSQSVFNYSGLTPEQIEKDGWIQIIHPDDHAENTRIWSEAISTGEPFLFEHRFRRHDGEYRWQLSRAVPQRDSTGRIQMWVGTSTDIHDLKRNEQLKDDFIKMASHELKTPVTTIKGYVQLLTNVYKDNPDKVLAGSLSTIDKHVSKLTNLITDLLDVTKIEIGKLHLSKETFNINELVAEIVRDMQTTTSTHKIIFIPGTNAQIVADRDRVSQVLINLLVNAIKYSPNAKEVIIKTKLLPGEIQFSFQDFGIGIYKDDLERIFERFYRVQGKNEKTFPGFGIGLYVVKEIVTNHGGRIWVESKKDEGSTFYFCLPLANQEPGKTE